ncbi:MAG: uroporphyrinogen-III synthase [Acetobacter sp.]|nr:uroporphyrinogen-III synthase [Acetobacter sp.]MCH4060233.1 uroporphyrinogen-III synthase [Acetobacter sp.]MCH4087173.1 uroporphyrinogen-III synthase [Acetobacter sp.]MCI1292993.1 uroporphyrinogen-III synthase [Acetobacter sp.]MCI1319579.1 uroporphyrinogen-III synthase [Acetobacter sp.]
MLENAPGVLITRPEPGLSATLRDVQALGWTAFSAPALAIMRVTSLRLSSGKFQAAIITSSQSLPILQKLGFMDMPLLAVGDVTAERARNAGFQNVESAAGDADALINLITRRLQPGDGTLLLLSGAQQGLPLLADLRNAHFKVLRRISYRTCPVDTVPADARHALQNHQISTVMVFSTASAQATLRLIQKTAPDTLPRLRWISISPRASAPLRKAGLRDIHAADHPDTATMLRLLGPYKR